jgi:3-hydroxybutyryl-CoA dehydrogenase
MQVSTIGIIGAGTMGIGIAQVCAVAGLDVVLTDLDDAIVKRAAATVARNLDRLVAKSRLSAADKEAIWLASRARPATIPSHPPRS